MVAAQVAQRNEDLIACSLLLPMISFSIVFTIQPCHKKNTLTHLFRMEFPTVINWTCKFPFLGLLGGIFHCYSNLDRTIYKQTVETLIRRRVFRRLIRVCTVYLFFYKSTIDIIGVKRKNYIQNTFVGIRTVLYKLYG